MPVPGPKESSTIVSVAAGSFHPGALEGLAEKAQKLSPGREGCPRLGAEQSHAGRKFLQNSLLQDVWSLEPWLHNKLQSWLCFKWAVKEISLILPEETEHWLKL